MEEAKRHDAKIKQTMDKAAEIENYKKMKVQEKLNIHGSRIKELEEKFRYRDYELKEIKIKQKEDEVRQHGNKAYEVMEDKRDAWLQ